MTQPQFAAAAGLTITSISRYENGREPSRLVLQRFADMARGAGIAHLADLFSAKRKAEVISKVENLRSPGSARPVSLHELLTWQRWQEDIVHTAKNLEELVRPETKLEQFNQQELRELLSGIGTALLGIMQIASGTSADLNLHINPPQPFDPNAATIAQFQPRSAEENAALIRSIAKQAAKLWGRPYEEKSQAKPASTEESDSGDGSTDH